MTAEQIKSIKWVKGEGKFTTQFILWFDEEWNKAIRIWKKKGE